MAMATQQLEKEEEDVKWVNHYSSSHQILLVGEGDFSFSLCLALAFGSASNIYASSLDSYDEVIKKYKKGKSNVDTLKGMKASVLHGVDATQMKSHSQLRMQRFDRIVFNFPHAGFYGKEDNEHMIGMHRDLLNGFFKSASRMLRANGEVHVSHKTEPPYDRWNLKDLAFKNSLVLIEPVVEFKMEDYPGYNNKRGNGNRCDDHFPLGECSTFKFELFPAANKNFRVKNNKVRTRRSLQLKEIPVQFQKLETPFDSRCCDIFLTKHWNARPGSVGWLPLSTYVQRESLVYFNGCFSNVSETFRKTYNGADYNAYVSPGFDCFGRPQRNVPRHMNDFPGYVDLPLTCDIQKEKVRIFDGCFNNVKETHGRFGNHADYSFHGSHFSSFERWCMANAPERILSGDSSVVNKDRLSILRRMVRDYGG